MMSKVSSNKFHPALQLYKYSARRTGGLTILISIFMMIIIPGYILKQLNDRMYMSYKFNLDEILPEFIMLTACLTSAVALIYLFINFAYLYNRSSSDFFHALPLKRKGLLASRFFASIIPVIIPTTLTYGSLCLISVFSIAKGDIKLILFGFVYNIFIILALSAYSLIFIVCAGSIFDLIVSYLTFNIGIFVIQFIFYDLCDSLLIGFSNIRFDKFLMLLNPIYYIFGNFGYLINRNDRININVTVYTVKLLLLIAVFLISAFLLYSKRKSEKSGVSYAYRFISLICEIIIGIIGAYLLGSIFSDGNKNLIFWTFAIVGSLLATVTFRAINERGFKQVKNSLIIGGCSIFLVITTSLILWSGGFGYTKRIPEKSDIKSAEIYFSNFEIPINNPDLLLKLHKKIVSNNNNTRYDYISLSYSLKNGKTLDRDFHVDYDDYAENLTEIYKSEDNINYIKDTLSNFEGKNVSMRYNRYDDAGNTTERADSIILTAQDIDKLKNAYTEDIKLSKKLISGNNHSYISIYLYCEDDLKTNDFYLSVKEDFYNTIEFIGTYASQAVSESKY